ncbi:hypothetical protein E2C01_073355 [Portunus trituberculatus]|uniref:Uncharacterized protein n=1 Tax=Portunus trituberculatus TaxID=210409 RepID=A0A5B7I978_PORTR|nr:hypothetical protein [Portunus trituberculatus]
MRVETDREGKNSGTLMSPQIRSVRATNAVTPAGGGEAAMPLTWRSLKVRAIMTLVPSGTALVVQGRLKHHDSIPKQGSSNVEHHLAAATAYVTRLATKPLHAPRDTRPTPSATTIVTISTRCTNTADDGMRHGSAARSSL